VRVTARATDDAVGGADLAAGIVRASRFAEVDVFRAATHNKGIMNGVDAVALAFGQDWRAIEAGAHSFAALSGRYRPLATWRRASGTIEGTLAMPLAAAATGGSTRVHPGVRAAFDLAKIGSARELALVMGAAGLASNLAALRALAGEGIQRGHMKLHMRKLEALPEVKPSERGERP
jgi:hydroxymethylglutaryl-CoA reductase